MDFMKSIKATAISLTSKLWLQYINIIEIFCRFIKAEITGCWKEHLQANQDMLPHLTASGHYLYVKSAYLYLQTTVNLQNTHIWYGVVIASGAYGVVVSMFHFHRSDRGSNPGRGGKIS